MPELEVDFSKYLPQLGVYYNYYTILKDHHFIDEVNVKEEDSTLLVTGL